MGRVMVHSIPFRGVVVQDKGRDRETSLCPPSPSQ